MLSTEQYNTLTKYAFIFEEREVVEFTGDQLCRITVRKNNGFVVISRENDITQSINTKKIREEFVKY
ncbi:hypothetical protein O3M35_002633 [Rhynocoris fuscipes]|uniref:Uncharacterized protein n=1 Tax=Rhynocoris fuscipes TaxID=488301 RepID=A0AAW1CTP0_9HEMI